MKPIVYTLTLAIIMLACAELRKKQVTEKPQSEEQEQKKVVKKIPQPDTIKVKDYKLNEHKMPLKNTSIDSVVQALNAWNRALVHKNYTDLRKCYAYSVGFYTRKVSRTDLIKDKKNWLDKNPDYRQEIKDVEVRHPRDASDTIHCVFSKMYRTKAGAKQDSARAVIYMVKNQGHYKIFKESDMASERATARTLPARKLPYGEYTFLHGYWLDTRADEVLAHNFVPYYTGLKIHYFNNELRLELYSYSGQARMIIDYETKDASFENGILSFKAATIMIGATRYQPTKKDYQTFKFKVLNPEVMVLVSASKWSYLEGARFWIKKNN